MEILLNWAYTGKMYYSKAHEGDVITAMKLLYFGEFADMTLTKVSKREKPTTSSEVQNILG